MLLLSHSDCSAAFHSRPLQVIRRYDGYFCVGGLVQDAETSTSPLTKQDDSTVAFDSNAHKLLRAQHRYSDLAYVRDLWICRFFPVG